MGEAPVGSPSAASGTLALPNPARGAGATASWGQMSSSRPDEFPDLL
jgi:hypothetical protein